MTSEWRKPTNEEAARGFVAMLREVYYCQHPDGAWADGRRLRAMNVDSKGQARWVGYNAERLERRAKWGGDMPEFLATSAIAA